MRIFFTRKNISKKRYGLYCGTWKVSSSKSRGKQPLTDPTATDSLFEGLNLRVSEVTMFRNACLQS